MLVSRRSRQIHSLTSINTWFQNRATTKFLHTPFTQRWKILEKFLQSSPFVRFFNFRKTTTNFLQSGPNIISNEFLQSINSTWKKSVQVIGNPDKSAALNSPSTQPKSSVFLFCILYIVEIFCKYLNKDAKNQGKCKLICLKIFQNFDRYLDLRISSLACISKYENK